MRLQFPEGFLLGVSSASAQIEGGEVGSNWNDWYHQGRIKDDSDPAVADDHWNRWREDCALMAGLHLPIARMGVEWARIMPARGEVDEAAIAHYRAELEYMRQLGIRPLLTIHHFSNPMWFERLGGFSKRENLDDFLSFAKLCADRFGDLVSDWITINEPNVYATNGYFFGDWPPGHKSFSETFTVLENMAFCHIRCYQMLHATREAMGYSDTMVGFANHLRVFEPENPKNPVQAATARAVEWLFQGAITQAMSTGVFRLPLKNHWKLPKGEYCDFHGVNYYTRSTVTALPTASGKTARATTSAGRFIPTVCRRSQPSWKSCSSAPSGSRKTAPVTIRMPSAPGISTSTCTPCSVPACRSSGIITGASATTLNGSRARVPDSASSTSITPPRRARSSAPANSTPI